jgi:hypothetical protein
MAPSTPPRSASRSNSSSTAASTSSVSCSTMKLPWLGFWLKATPHSLSTMSWMAMAPAHRRRGGRGHGLVEGVGVEAVAVVVDGAQRLQGGADVVERHLLGVHRAAGRLHVVLELLAALVGPVAVAQHDRPDAPGHPAQHRVLGVHAAGEEERQVGGEVVDVHAPGQVRLDVGEGVGQVKASWLTGFAPPRRCGSPRSTTE